MLKSKAESLKKVEKGMGDVDKSLRFMYNWSVNIHVLNNAKVGKVIKSFIDFCAV